MNQEITPIETFTVEGVTYSLDNAASSDAAFDSLRQGMDSYKRDHVIDTISHLRDSNRPATVIDPLIERAETELVSRNNFSAFELYAFAKTLEGLPFLIAVASPEIQDERDGGGRLVRSKIDVARYLVSKMDQAQIGRVLLKAIYAGGIAKRKNSDGPARNQAATVQSSQTDLDSTDS